MRWNETCLSIKEEYSAQTGVDAGRMRLLKQGNSNDQGAVEGEGSQKVRECEKENQTRLLYQMSELVATDIISSTTVAGVGEGADSARTPFQKRSHKRRRRDGSCRSGATIILAAGSEAVLMHSRLSGLLFYL